MGELALSSERLPQPDKLLIQEYILETLSYYTCQNRTGGLDYQAEYVLGGKNSDQKSPLCGKPPSASQRSFPILLFCILTDKNVRNSRPVLLPFPYCF